MTARASTARQHQLGTILHADMCNRDDVIVYFLTQILAHHLARRCNCTDSRAFQTHGAACLEAQPSLAGSSWDLRAALLFGLVY